MRTPLSPSLGLSLAYMLLGTALLGTGCADERAQVGPALTVFKRFQAALFSGDRDALRNLVTRESRQVVPELPLAAIADKQPLQVIGALRSGYRVHVEVSDPNEGDTSAWFVMAKERGKWVVDLVETAGFNHRSVESGDYTLSPRQLSPTEIERIRSQGTRAIR